MSPLPDQQLRNTATLRMARKQGRRVRIDTDFGGRLDNAQVINVHGGTVWLVVDDVDGFAPVSHIKEVTLL